MAIAVTLIGMDPIYVEFEPGQPRGGFNSVQSASAFEQGLLTRKQAISASWMPSARPPKAKATWR